MLGGRLQKFHSAGTNTFAFRCPICGDSKKSQNKTRGYIYEKNGSYLFKCHNCGETHSLGRFIEIVDSSLYSEYYMERFFSPKKKATVSVPKVKKFKVYDVGILKELVPMTELDDLSSVKQYVIGRQIPEEHWRHLFYCNEFKKFVNSLLPGKIKDNVSEESRLVIPFFDENKKMFAFAGRSFRKNTSHRYINIVLDEDKPKLFGIDRWKKKEETIVVEGPLDALFIDNTIATAGGDLVSAIRGFDKHRFIIAYDNEPRSNTTRDKILKAIDQGYRVVIWPKTNRWKDINKMVQEGMKPLDIHRQICDNAFSGLEAKLNLAWWTK